MIIGALPFTKVMVAMCLPLVKAVIRDVMSNQFEEAQAAPAK